MELPTRLLLDSGDPHEYKSVAKLAKENGAILWGATTNPSLIAKSAGGRTLGKKISKEEAFSLQQNIISQILDIVPGAVSAEVYADATTQAMEMVKEGREIARWHKRVVVKLPTTIEGFKARTILRKEKIPINNTLVFSQQQIFAICLHEQLVQNTFGPIVNEYPPFISPFLGRLDDQGENGIDLLAHGMKLKQLVKTPLWMLEASVRSPYHIHRGIELRTELITAPAKVYQEWFATPPETPIKMHMADTPLKHIEYWKPSHSLLSIPTIDALMQAISSKHLDITHPLTDKGLKRFAQDWNAIIQ